MPLALFRFGPGTARHPGVPGLHWLETSATRNRLVALLAPRVVASPRHRRFGQRFFDDLLVALAAVLGLGVEDDAVGQHGNGQRADVVGGDVASALEQRA